MMGEIQRLAAVICPGLIARARATANKTHRRLEILQIRSGVSADTLLVDGQWW
jgi:hypothetical protein